MKSVPDDMGQRDPLWPMAREHFLRLCGRPADERAAVIAQLRSRNAALADYLAGLLDRDALDATVVTDGSGTQDSEPDPASNHLAGRRGPTAGSWQLDAIIGRGGMGEVWRARRTTGDFEQVAAVKLLKRGMDSDAVLARFLQERRILARLEHANIAHLLDGGVTQSGLPYFVMELVEGRPINEHVQEHHLGLRDTLRLFIKICAAVDFAHRNLVVHRDLKASNILVDESGEPKLLDFGIAKLLRAEDNTLALTETGTNALTPACAAPEQLYGEPITTATDVFALGLILFQLITGDLPEQRRRSSIEAMQVDLDADISQRPSQVLRRFEDEAVLAEPARVLAREVQGDLDAIVLVALRRDPVRRYASAAAMAEDLNRFLAGHPVSARPDSLGYRLGRFVRRHRAAVSAAVLAIAALCIGLVMALWQAQVARDALSRLEIQMQRTEQEAERAESAKDFLVDLFQIANPGNVDGDATRTVRDVLLSADARLESSLADQPVVQAELRSAIAQALRGYGEREASLQLVRKSLDQLQQIPREDSAVLNPLAAALHLHGSLLVDSGDLVEAEGLVQQAESIYEQFADSPGNRQRRRAVNTSLALIYNLSGRSDAALDLRRADLEERSAELTSNHPELATSWYNLGISYLQVERHREALDALQRTEQIMAPQGELASPRRVYLWASLALVHASLGGDRNAGHYLRQLRELLDTHMAERADLHSILHRTDAAVALLANRFADALAVDAGSWSISSTGTHQPDLATQTAPRITSLLIAKHYDEALTLANLAEADSTQRRGADHYLSIHMRAAAAFAAWMLGRDATQLERLQLAVEKLDEAPTRRHVGQAAAWLSVALREQDPQSAEIWAERAARALGQAYGEQHPWRMSLAGTRLSGE